MTKCSNCGSPLAEEQIVAALEDASLTLQDRDSVTFCCSSYTDEDGCQGNDQECMAYWYTCGACQAFRLFQGRDTTQVNGVSGKAADDMLWYWEPNDYEGDVLWSEGFRKREDACAAAENYVECEAEGA